MYYLCSKNKDDQLHGNVQLISAFVFAYAKSMFTNDVAQMMSHLRPDPEHAVDNPGVLTAWGIS